MDEYSIEKRSEKIFHSKTKEYFEEVVSSYREGNYRSATVMLWSVVVCDLLFKLKYMVDMYGDSVASGIIDKVGKIQEENERSSEWELKLVELISERTKLLEISDVMHLRHLQQQRHLAAHPVLSKDLELHRPNRETVRALIRNAIDGILMKPPIYTTKVFDEFINDLAESKDILIDDAKLKTYLESKYFAHAGIELVKSIFRSLWKLVFRLIDDECNLNRQINYRALTIILKKYQSDLISSIESDKEYFSNIASSGEPSIYLVWLLSQFPSIYGSLTDAAKIIIQYTISNNVLAKCIGWFIQPSLKDHYQLLSEWITGDDFPDLPNDAINALRKISDSSEWESMCHKLFAAYYGASRSYDHGDARFSTAIEPFIGSFEKDELILLLSGINLNGQTYDRRGAKMDHGKIKPRCDEVLGPFFDYTMYPNFCESLE